jgi:hypothetical protein
MDGVGGGAMREGENKQENGALFWSLDKYSDPELKPRANALRLSAYCFRACTALHLRGYSPPSPSQQLSHCIAHALSLIVVVV